jgi:Tol biopolymer transport system component
MARTLRWAVVAAVIGVATGYAGVTAYLAQQPPPGVFQDLWLHEAGKPALTRLTSASEPGRISSGASISGDGRRIVFHSDSDFQKQGHPPGTPEIWLYDVASGQLTRITTASASDRSSLHPAISADGSTVVFQSDSDFLKEGLPRGQSEIWRYLVSTRALTRVTRGAAGTSSTGPAINANGTIIAFSSSAALAGSPAAGSARPLWLFDVAANRFSLIAGPGTTTAARPSLSATGARVVFDSASDIWLYDVPSKQLTRVTTSGPSRASEAAAISADGARVVFHSDADLLKEDRPDSVDEIWLYEVESKTLKRLTSIWARDAGPNADFNAVLQPDCQYPRITADGRTVVFASDGDFLNEKLPNGIPNVWTLDIASGKYTRVDTAAGSTGSGPAINADASRIVLFRTDFDGIRGARVGAPTRSLRYLPLPPPPPPTPRPTRLTAEQADKDLTAFQADLEARWSYLKANGVDYRAAIAGIREKTTAGIGIDEYGLEIQKFISRFIDGHSNVGGYRTPPGYLPFLIEPSGARFVALKPDRTSTVDSDLPFVTRIDGRPLADWIEAARPYAPQGSPQYRQHQALRQIRNVQFLRQVLRLPTPDALRVELQSEDGTRTREIEMTVSTQSPVFGVWPTLRTRLLEGNVGYLRIPAMNSAAATDIDAWMPKFRETRGLIVDVRGNGGGSREALRALFPYVMAPGAPAVVVSTAKYRLHPDFAEDHMGGSRFMYRESWTGWTPEERAAIARFKPTFKPEWTPPEKEFSEWHYLVMARSTNPKAFAYGKPVIILMDQKCFSATDIFLSAFKGYPSVTLMGSASGGGSALQVSYRMPISLLSMTLASMASFQTSGQLYDARGVHPDVVVHPDPGYFLNGGRDNILEEALKRLK